MPRKAPDGNGVIEHRITLGNYERDQLNSLADAKKTQLYMSPLQSPVLAAGVVGAAGYLGLAYAFEWWPFEPKKSAMGFSWADVGFTAMFENTEKADAMEVEELAKLDASKLFAEKWLAEHPAPTTLFGRITQRGASKIVTEYPQSRLDIIDKYARWRVLAAEKAAAIRAKSDYV